ncbi:MAG: DUF5672 family protein [Kiritimatiellia bacterium]
MKSECSHKAAIIIPVYKTELNRFETMSLERCRGILSRYRRILVCPESLDPAAYKACDPGIETARFPDKYFTSLMAYSRLCCQPEFYARFRDYEFILIYQLDCYVFEDRLLYWCERDFDYLGAPWPNFEHMSESKKIIARLPFLKLVLRDAGQGGFSLRKTEVLYRASKTLSKLAFLTSRFPEDVLWTTLAGRLFRPFKLAGMKEALPFSFASSFETCFRLNAEKLPFGCHGWYTYGREFWKDKIRELE